MSKHKDILDSPIPERNLNEKPYNEEELRVCDYLLKITKGQIGCGSDPVGFLIASHETLRHNYASARRRIKTE